MLKIDYDAFGKPYYSDEESFGYDTNNQYDLKFFFKLGFKGYYYDDESGLYYTGSRYYNPVSGRYISPDNVNNMSFTTRGGLSLYNYSYNNPIRATTGIKAVDAKHSTQIPRVKQKWFFSDDPSLLNLSSRGFEGASWSFNVFRGSLFLDDERTKSLYINILNFDVFFGRTFEDENGLHPNISLIEYGYDGKYIDFSFSFLNLDAFLDLLDGKPVNIINLLFDIYIDINWGKIFT